MHLQQQQKKAQQIGSSVIGPVKRTRTHEKERRQKHFLFRRYLANTATAYDNLISTHMLLRHLTSLFFLIWLCTTESLLIISVNKSPAASQPRGRPRLSALHIFFISVETLPRGAHDLTQFGPFAAAVARASADSIVTWNQLLLFLVAVTITSMK